MTTFTADNTFVINLKGRTDRFKTTCTTMSRNNIEFTRYDAVNGRKLEDNVLRKLLTSDAYDSLDNSTRSKHSQLTRGGVGCALSHIGLWQQLLEDPGNQQYLIFEDDVYFNTEYSRMAQRLGYKSEPAIVAIETVWTDLQTHGIEVDVLLFQPTKPSWMQVIDYQEPPVLVSDRFKIVPQNYFWGMGGYIVTKPGASKLLDGMFPLSSQIDAVISMKSIHGEVNVLSTSPNLVDQSSQLGTNIQSMCRLCDINREIVESVDKKRLRVPLRKCVVYNRSLFFTGMFAVVLVLLIVWQRRRNVDTTR